MSWTLGFLLLVIVLVDISTSRMTAPAQFKVTKKQIRKCRCKESHNNLLKCHSPLLPTKYQEKINLIKCLCKKTDIYMFPELKAVCSSWYPEFPITLV